MLVDVGDGLANSESEETLKELIDKMNNEFGEVNMQRWSAADYLGKKTDLSEERGVYYSQTGLVARKVEGEQKQLYSWKSESTRHNI